MNTIVITITKTGDICTKAEILKELAKMINELPYPELNAPTNDWDMDLATVKIELSK